MDGLLQPKEGEYTATVYRMIKEGKFIDVVHLLNLELQSHPKSRPALSLLGYCYYQLQDFVNAAECYEQLSQLHPEVDDYKLYHAQALYKACMYQEATKATFTLESPAYQAKILKLQAAIKYGEEDLSGAKSLVEQGPSEDPDTDINLGCLLYKEGRYEEACQKFTTAMQILGYKADLSYNIALCYYSMRQYAPALKHIADIIERGIRDHPELSVGMTTEGIDVRSVGNTLILHETALIEAFNLKAAIEHQLKNLSAPAGEAAIRIHDEAAKEALTDMPPRAEEELDPVTLHNQALMNMDNNPTQGFEKLQFLLQQNPFPPETFGNLLLLYIKYEYYDLAADVLAENAHLTYKYLSPTLYDFMDAVITCQTAPEEAYRKLDEMASKQTDQLRKLTKQVQEARQNHDDESVKKTVNEYDEALERYIPILMAQAKIYWDLENYSQVEKIFRKSVEFCNEHEMWRLNVAHVLFMQESKFKEATGFYEPIVKKHYDNILNVSAIVLANLCVSYIMTRNYEFGISRVIKSLEPYNKKLGTDTWFYAKRCFMSLLENMAKHMIMLRDSIVQESIQFLEHCEAYGKDVPAVVEQPLEEEPMHEGRNTVTFEARLLKALFLELLA
ncbi:Tetratricopeptide repeat protein 30A [Branchiostoma belcheri]|nr:Tetratricopeptide repeat protein 30A [Branchiostoma belcheri]